MSSSVYIDRNNKKSFYEKLGIESILPKVSIIAMKGPPFTRKTELATLIATSLGCPILSYEHFLLELKPPLSREREDEAFSIICRMTHYHLFKKVSKNVVIDSSLSSEWHLIQLIKVVSSLCGCARARLVIIKCKPMNLYLWQLKLEQHLSSHPPSPCEWYKPKNWGDVEKFRKVNDCDYDNRYVEGHRLVSKLVVDPPSDHPIYDVDATLSLF